MGAFVEFLSDNQPKLGQITGQDKTRLTVSDERGRSHRVTTDRVLFHHSGTSLATLRQQLDRLKAEVDVPLLWEMLDAEQDLRAKGPDQLARLYFSESDAPHRSAMLRALWEDKLYFKRRGSEFTPRTRAEVDQVRQMREAEARAAAQLVEVQDALAQRKLDAPIAQRLEAWLRGRTDRTVETALRERGGEPNRLAFDMLADQGYLPPTATIEVLQANLQQRYPEAVLAEAAQLSLSPGGEPVETAQLTIDDPDTREVDDALSVSEDGRSIRVDVDIADVSAFVKPGDALDHEAARRATTVYLPTGAYYMLPPPLGCERGSLLEGHERPAMRMSIWFSPDAEVQRYELRRCWIRVTRRLDYDSADALLRRDDAADVVVKALRLLQSLADKRRQIRRSAGALLLQRSEWKLRVNADASEVTVCCIAPGSPSRMMVGEMMIITNELAARWAIEHSVPLIFRVQQAPTQPLPEIRPDDPSAFLKLRGLISPASLSLAPQPHWGLGVSAYTQVTSPLRRYADLVQQRQLLAAVHDEPPPYDAQSLLEVLATVEGTDQQMKRLETSVTQRWALEHTARHTSRKGLAARVVGQISGGLKLQLLESGAEGILLARKFSDYDVGDLLTVDVDRVNPRRGSLRMVPSHP